MRIKLDENIGQRGKALLMEAGHEAYSMRSSIALHFSARTCKSNEFFC